jgi:hypothetical protein
MGKNSMGSKPTAPSSIVLPLLALAAMTTGCTIWGMEAIADDARLKTFTCSGELWNISTDSAGPAWLEIGHGVYQCSIRNASSENARRILSVCNLKADCSVKVEVDALRLQKSAAEGECDDVCIFEDDKIVSVKKGKAKQ